MSGTMKQLSEVTQPHYTFKTVLQEGVVFVKAEVASMGIIKIRGFLRRDVVTIDSKIDNRVLELTAYVVCLTSHYTGQNSYLHP